MSRISRVTDQLYTGADLPRHSDEAWAHELARWDQLGITHVVDNRIEASDLHLLAEVSPGFTYLENGEDDLGQQMPDTWFNTGVNFTLEALREPSAKVHVHCHMGINRGPSMAFAVLLALGHAPVPAIRLIRSARPVAAVAYAEQALDWWHRMQGVPAAQRREEQRELAAWRQANRHDTVRLIQQVRDAEWREQVKRARNAGPAPDPKPRVES